LDLRSRGWGLAAKTFEPQSDGRIKLAPFSAFVMAKKQTKPGQFPEINTLRCDEAYLTLDHPVNNTAELGNRKVIAVELRSQSPLGITIKNNRGTDAVSDDVEVSIKDAPLFYAEKDNVIWTTGFVKLLDWQSGLHPTKIDAKGMELHLTKEASPAGDSKTTRKSKKGEGISGVELLVLLADVKMQLYVDARSGFLASGPDAKKAPAAANPGDKNTQEVKKAHLNITTQGRFTYDLAKEKARFESPKQNPAATFSEHVDVQRYEEIDVNFQADDNAIIGGCLLLHDSTLHPV
jgi:hypothetical protein